jgi:hypothetical protein
MKTIKQHVPNCIGFKAETANFETVEELFAIDWISYWSTLPWFLEFEVFVVDSRLGAALVANFEGENNNVVVGFCPGLAEFKELIK